MRLAQDWKVILRKAWSVRLMAVAIALSALEALWPVVFECSPSVPFALLSLLVTLLALLARITAQKGVLE